jgi:hypothetical protein
MNFAGGVDPSENLTWFRPSQIGIYNWAQFDSPEFEKLYQQGMAETDAGKARRHLSQDAGPDGGIRRLRVHHPRDLRRRNARD